MPALFALTDQVIGNLQMALFAAFGAFAILVLANFEGTAREKLGAHTGLALAGSVLLVIGTAVTHSTVLAVAVTIPVTFAVFFAGVAGPNAAGGVTAALLAYVLPAATPGAISTIPDRLAGWWLASVVGTTAVLAIPTPRSGDRLRAAISSLAAQLADEIARFLSSPPSQARLAACVEAKHALLAEFNSTPYRPTGLAVAAQATANAVELAGWCASLVVDTLREGCDVSRAPPQVRAVWQAAAAVLRGSAALFAGGSAWPRLEELEARRQDEVTRLEEIAPDSAEFEQQAQLSFHAHAFAAATLAFGGDSVVAARLAGADWLAHTRARWFGDSTRAVGSGQLTGVSKYAGIARRHTSLRSTWFINSARGSLALAGAVAVADVSNVQHGFWVVLAALSVLRTNAMSTGSTAIRAVLGTTAGFVVGALLLLAIGTDTAALWAVLPVVVLVAAYAPGAFSFAVGQAAFTVTVAILFNLLVPVGWHVGLLRVEDVALGCAVSIVVGGLFWPRGMAAVVAKDLADGYRAGAAYLSHTVGWVSGLRADPPDEAKSAVAAGLRLDAALRSFLAERGAKHLRQDELWRVVGGAVRLRLTAYSIAKLPRPRLHHTDPAGAMLSHRAEILVGFYERLSAQLDGPRGQSLAVLPAPSFPDDGLTMSLRSSGAIWLGEHLEHLREHLPEVAEPAAQVAEIRRRPWWR